MICTVVLDEYSYQASWPIEKAGRSWDLDRPCVLAPTRHALSARAKSTSTDAGTRASTLDGGECHSAHPSLWRGHGCDGDTPLSDSLSPLAAKAREESQLLVIAAAKAADDKLGHEPVALDVGDLLSVVDYFFVVSGRNDRQIHAICDAIEEEVKATCSRAPLRIEGLREGTWILMDYGDVVVHIFEEEARRYYDLEHLWLAAPRLALAEFSSVTSED